MTTEREINWAAPVVGKLEVGKTYVDREGVRHVYQGDGNWFTDGRFLATVEARHPMDLIAEHVPPPPLKMWMNAFKGEAAAACLFGTEDRAKKHSDGYDRIAVPVTITEGHEP